jgi:hypothetical protein
LFTCLLLEKQPFLSVYEIQQSKYRQGYHVTVIVVSGQNADTQLWKRDDELKIV